MKIILQVLFLLSSSFAWAMEENPFLDNSCSTKAISNVELAQKIFPPGETKVTLTASIYSRSRQCNKITGCTQWSTPEVYGGNVFNKPGVLDLHFEIPSGDHIRLDMLSKNAESLYLRGYCRSQLEYLNESPDTRICMFSSVNPASPYHYAESSKIGDIGTWTATENCFKAFIQESNKDGVPVYELMLIKHI